LLGSSHHELISCWQLEPHPEGGCYRELQRSSTTVQRVDEVPPNAITMLLFLSSAEDVSRWHCVHGGEELWTFLDGNPLCLLQHPNSEQKTETSLLHRGNPVAWFPAGVWMSFRCESNFSLVSCCGMVCSSQTSWS